MGLLVVFGIPALVALVAGLVLYVKVRGYPILYDCTSPPKYVYPHPKCSLCRYTIDWDASCGILLHEHQLTSGRIRVLDASDQWRESINPYVKRLTRE